MSANPNSKTPLALSTPTCIVFSGGSQLHNIYRDTNNHLSDIYYDVNNGGWIYQDLNQLAPQAPLAKGTPHAVLFNNDTQHHNLYRDVNDNLSDIYYIKDAQWHYQNLNQLAPQAPLVKSNPFSIIFNGNGVSEHHNLYLDTNNHLSDIYYIKDAQWHYQDLHQLQPQAPLANSAPAAVVFKESQHNVYLDINNHLSDIYYVKGSGWHYEDLHQLKAQAPLAKTKPSCVAFIGTQWHSVYLDENNHLSDIYYGEGTGWNYQDLHSLVTGAPNATTEAFSMVVGNQHHNYYVDINGHLSDIYYEVSSGWHYRDLNQLQPEAPITQSVPCAIYFDLFEQEHILYEDVNNNISDIYYTQNRGWNYESLNSNFSNTLDMSLIESGYLSANDINSYHLEANDFSVSVMIKPKSGGTLVSSSSFNLEINEQGEFIFTVFKQGALKSVVSEATNVINSGQCHTVSFLNPDENTPLIYLDGEQLEVSSSTWSGNIPTRNQTLTVGYTNLLTHTNQYHGGIMNIGIWGRLLEYPELMLAGAGHINSLQNGLMGFWSLNAVYQDSSANKNNLVVNGNNIIFKQCPNCVWLKSYFDSSFMQVLGPLPQDNSGAYTFSQTVNIAKNSPALFATILDGSGYAKFPEGAILTITDPSGTVYNGKNINNQSIFSQSENMTSDGKSLFALCINNPLAGTWTVNITTTANLNFEFCLQSFPYQDFNWSFLQTSPRIRAAQHQPHDHQQLQGFWSTVGIALMVVSAVVVIGAAVVASGATVVVPAALGLTTSQVIGIGAIGTVALGMGAILASDSLQHAVIRTSNTFGEKIGWTNAPIPPLRNDITGGYMHYLSEGPSSYGLKGGRMNLRARMVFVEFNDVKFSSLPSPNNNPDTIYTNITQNVNEIYQSQSYNKTSVNIIKGVTRTLNHDRNYYLNKKTFINAFYNEVHDLYSDLDWTEQDFIYIVAAGSLTGMTAWWTPIVLKFGEIDIYPVVFPEQRYYEYLTLIHETGHAAGLPDLYLYDDDNPLIKIGKWDYMGYQFDGSSFLAWHRHKLCWLDEKRKLYFSKKKDNPDNKANPTQWTLTPLNGDVGLSCIVLCDTKEVWKDSDGRPHVLLNHSSPCPNRVLVLEVAKNPAYPEQSGVLIYTVDGMIPHGKGPITVIPPSSRDLEHAAWGIHSGIYEGNLYTVQVISQEGDNWVVEIKYTGDSH